MLGIGAARKRDHIGDHSRAGALLPGGLRGTRRGVPGHRDTAGRPFGNRDRGLSSAPDSRRAAQHQHLQANRLRNPRSIRPPYPRHARSSAVSGPPRNRSARCDDHSARAMEPLLGEAAPSRHQPSRQRGDARAPTGLSSRRLHRRHARRTPTPTSRDLTHGAASPTPQARFEADALGHELRYAGWWVAEFGCHAEGVKPRPRAAAVCSRSASRGSQGRARPTTPTSVYCPATRTPEVNG